MVILQKNLWTKTSFLVAERNGVFVFIRVLRNRHNHLGYKFPKIAIKKNAGSLNDLNNPKTMSARSINCCVLILGLDKFNDKGLGIEANLREAFTDFLIFF